jgi:hypothetical protein
VLAIVLEDMKILGRVSARFQEGAIKGIIDFQEGKMLEVFGHALNR